MCVLWRTSWNIVTMYWLVNTLTCARDIWLSVKYREIMHCVMVVIYWKMPGSYYHCILWLTQCKHFLFSFSVTKIAVLKRKYPFLITVLYPQHITVMKNNVRVVFNLCVALFQCRINQMDYVTYYLDLVACLYVEWTGWTQGLVADKCLTTHFVVGKECWYHYYTYRIMSKCICTGHS